MNDFHIALHEAGHAWAAHVLGAEVTALSVVPGKDNDGYCSHKTVGTDRPWREHTVIKLAGMAAVQTVAGNTILPDARGTGGAHDLKEAAFITGSHVAYSQSAVRITPSNRFMRAWDDAVDLVREHFQQIHRLASFLDRHRQMGRCCAPAIAHIAAGKDMAHWRYCAYCGVRLPESEATA